MARDKGLNAQSDLNSLVVWFSIRKYPAHQGGGATVQGPYLTKPKVRTGDVGFTALQSFTLTPKETILT